MRSGVTHSVSNSISVNTNRSAVANDIAYVAPSVEAITEFIVNANGFNAEYVKAGGVTSQVNEPRQRQIGLKIYC